MAKLLLLSIVLIMIAVPVLASRAQSGRRSLKLVIVLTIVLNVIYLLAVRYLYPHLV